MRPQRIAIALALLALAACSAKPVHFRGGSAQRSDGTAKGSGGGNPDSKKEQLSAVAGPGPRVTRDRPALGFGVDSKPQQRKGMQAAAANRRPAPRIDPVTGLRLKRNVAASDPYGTKPKRKPTGNKNAQRPLPPPNPYPAPPR